DQASIGRQIALGRARLRTCPFVYSGNRLSPSRCHPEWCPAERNRSAAKRNSGGVEASLPPRTTVAGEIPRVHYVIGVSAPLPSACYPLYLACDRPPDQHSSIARTELRRAGPMHWPVPGPYPHTTAYRKSN